MLPSLVCVCIWSNSFGFGGPIDIKRIILLCAIDPDVND